MQVYEGFSVLTNQPWRQEDRPDLHELVGFLDPGSAISAGEYAVLATPLVERSVRESGSALLVGGSGLYMRATLAPLALHGPGDPGLRETLEDRAKAEGPEALHRELSHVDAEAAASIDARNVRRVVRALETILTHKGVWSGRGDLWSPEYYRPTLTVGLRMDGELLASRIMERTKRMLSEGAVQEVAQFRRKYGEARTEPGLPGIRSAIGYGEIVAHLGGEIDLHEAMGRMAGATRRYARRQSTWLRKVKDAVMIETKGREPAQIAREIAVLAERVTE